MPHEDGPDGEDRVNQAASDRVFLNIFDAETNTAGAAVNASPYGQTDSAADFTDRDHRAHVFCTFGLSVVDFPVQRVIEACQKRLLSAALVRKLAAAADDMQSEQLLSRMELGWDRLLTDLTADDGDLDNHLRSEIRSIRERALTDTHDATERLSRLRRSFGRTAEPGAELGDPGGITRYLRDRRLDLLDSMTRRTNNVLRDALSDPDISLRTIQKCLGDAVAFVEQLAASSRTSSPSAADLSGHMERLQGYSRHPLLALGGIRKSATARARQRLDRELHRLVKELTQHSAASALVDGGDFVGDRGSASILASVQSHLNRTRHRLDEFNRRLQELYQQISAQSRKIETAKSSNGVTLIDQGGSGRGTACAAYREQLHNQVRMQGLGFEQAEQMHIRGLLEEIASLSGAISQDQESWLDRRYSIGSGDLPIPTEDYSRLSGR